MPFESLNEVWSFLAECDGKAPHDWVPSATPQSAAWCAVDLALLDTFGRVFQEPVVVRTVAAHSGEASSLHYSAVVSAGNSWSFIRSLLNFRLYGFRQVKLKAGIGERGRGGAIARRVLGKKCALRMDANMAWTFEEALQAIGSLAQSGIHWVEQPLASQNLEGAARLIQETGVRIIADESFTDRASLEQLVAKEACSGVNVRISKCGGLVAAAARCREALQAGLLVQIGCQVGESSLLSAAQLRLIEATPEVKFLEGCYGRHLLQEDPARPVLQLGYGGRKPRLPSWPGLGVEIVEPELERWTRRRATIGTADRIALQDNSHVLCS
jgi:muconate cycloisomerase